MNYYWKLTYGAWDDLKHIMIPPEPVRNGLSPIDAVKQRWESGQPINTSNGSIAASEIRTFEPTARPYSDQALLEAGAQAFKEAIYTDMGDQKFQKTDGKTGEIHYEGIAGKWVKQITTLQQWEKYFSHIDSYHKLYGDNGMVTMAFRKATHDIDVMLTPECTQQEVDMLTKGK